MFLLVCKTIHAISDGIVTVYLFFPEINVYSDLREFKASDITEHCDMTSCIK